ncbi:hypothetical protein CBS115989_8350 [Aspergillus niger]|nr:hypothetical protein CBS115989_8350 [Aspergillus niger]KAI2826840.1 hypothetical protein CBS133816_7089 [Aspergillus niger]KAI2847529.1 hypothetical protein CBS11350_3055 [Aspergillus niger]KAI2847722.1 hypothetical protein CBS11232_7067 [Aspergillus niger]KAI2859378.1 hypothetical protein CBS12448_5754 [Aspergillus niger]
MPAHRTEMKHFNINSFAPFPKVRARSSFFLFSLSFFFLFYDSGFHGQPKLSLRLWGTLLFLLCEALSAIATLVVNHFPLIEF